MQVFTKDFNNVKVESKIKNVIKEAYPFFKRISCMDSICVKNDTNAPQCINSNGELYIVINEDNYGDIENFMGNLQFEIYHELLHYTLGYTRRNIPNSETLLLEEALAVYASIEFPDFPIIFKESLRSYSSNFKVYANKWDQYRYYLYDKGYQIITKFIEENEALDFYAFFKNGSLIDINDLNIKISENEKSILNHKLYNHQEEYKNQICVSSDEIEELIKINIFGWC